MVDEAYAAERLKGGYLNNGENGTFVCLSSWLNNIFWMHILEHIMQDISLFVVSIRYYAWYTHTLWTYTVWNYNIHVMYYVAFFSNHAWSWKTQTLLMTMLIIFLSILKSQISKLFLKSQFYLSYRPTNNTILVQNHLRLSYAYNHSSSCQV